MKAIVRWLAALIVLGGASFLAYRATTPNPWTEQDLTVEGVHVRITSPVQSLPVILRRCVLTRDGRSVEIRMGENTAYRARVYASTTKRALLIRDIHHFWAVDAATLQIERLPIAEIEGRIRRDGFTEIVIPTPTKG